MKCSLRNAVEVRLRTATIAACSNASLYRLRRGVAPLSRRVPLVGNERLRPSRHAGRRHRADRPASRRHARHRRTVAALHDARRQDRPSTRAVSRMRGGHRRRDLKPACRSTANRARNAIARARVRAGAADAGILGIAARSGSRPGAAAAAAVALNASRRFPPYRRTRRPAPTGPVRSVRRSVPALRCCVRPRRPAARLRVRPARATAATAPRIFKKLIKRGVAGAAQFAHGIAGHMDRHAAGRPGRGVAAAGECDVGARVGRRRARRGS